MISLRSRRSKRPCEVEVHSDSQYVVNAFNQHWVDGWKRRGWKNAKKEPVKNPDLWMRLLNAMAPHQVKFVWVRGHAGTDLNERCDRSWPWRPPRPRALRCSTTRASRIRLLLLQAGVLEVDAVDDRGQRVGELASCRPLQAAP